MNVKKRHLERLRRGRVEARLSQPLFGGFDLARPGECSFSVLQSCCVVQGPEGPYFLFEPLFVRS